MTQLRLSSLIVVLLIGLVACTQGTTVTVGGTPVDDTAFITATVIVHDVEVGAVAIGDFFLLRHRTACSSLTEEAKLVVVACVNATKHLKEYATVYAPKILTALQGARDGLRIAATTPKETTTDKLQAVVALARVALQTAVDWATNQGFRKLQP